MSIELKRGDFVIPIDKAKHHLGHGVIAEVTTDVAGRKTFTVMWLSGPAVGWLESDLELSR